MQNEKMEMTQEMMGDAIDDAFEADDEEEETDNLVNQVLDEIGLTAGQEVHPITARFDSKACFPVKFRSCSSCCCSTFTGRGRKLRRRFESKILFLSEF